MRRVIKYIARWPFRTLRNMIWRFFRRVRRANFRRALLQAQAEADRTGRTQLIVYAEGDYRIYEKQYLKKLRNQRGMFRGMSNADIENMAELKIYKYVRPQKAS